MTNNRKPKNTRLKKPINLGKAKRALRRKTRRRRAPLLRRALFIGIPVLAAVAGLSVSIARSLPRQVPKSRTVPTPVPARGRTIERTAR